MKERSTYKIERKNTEVVIDLMNASVLILKAIIKYQITFNQINQSNLINTDKLTFGEIQM